MKKPLQGLAFRSFVVLAVLAGGCTIVAPNLKSNLNVAVDSKDAIAAVKAAAPLAAETKTSSASVPTTGASESTAVTKDDLDKALKDAVTAGASAATTTIIVVTPSASPDPEPTPTPMPTPTPVLPAWRELTGTFKFQGQINGQPAKPLGGAFDYKNGTSVFWLKDANGAEGPYALENASPSLSTGVYEPYSPAIGNEGFDQKKFAKRLNAGKGLVRALESGTKAVFESSFVSLPELVLPQSWFNSLGDVDDAASRLIIGKQWILYISPVAAPLGIKRVNALQDDWSGSDDNSTFGSKITHAFFSPAEGVVFFFTERGDAFALEEEAIAPR